MRVTKPDWLSSILSNLNWDILGVSLYIGDAIEDAVDWLIEWINVALQWGEALYAWAIDLREEVLEVVNLFLTNLNQAVVNILNTISTWGDILNEWWQARLTDIKGLIDIATEGLAPLLVAWGNFWTTTLPYLVSFQWLGDWWQSQLLELRGWFYSELGELTGWWQSQLLELREWFHSELQELLPFYDTLSDLWDSIAEFALAPFGWLEARFTDWFLGKE